MGSLEDVLEMPNNYTTPSESALWTIAIRWGLFAFRGMMTAKETIDACIAGLERHCGETGEIL